MRWFTYDTEVFAHDFVVVFKDRETGTHYAFHNDTGESRFQRLNETHPRQYEYCINGGEYNEDRKWIPNKTGLGMGHIFDEINSLYGDGFIKYK